MRRSQRIDVYRHTLERTREERAARVQEIQQRLVLARQRLCELQAYRQEYASALPQRIAQGLGAVALLDYQSFMARLQLAIEAQQELVQRTEQEEGFGVQRLREVAVQHQAVSAVIERWQQEERAGEQRREQRVSDERAQRPSALNLLREAS
jgi:flagellar protein FliJ